MYTFEFCMNLPIKLTDICICKENVSRISSQHLAENKPSVCTKLISRSWTEFNIENEICNENKDGYSYTFVIIGHPG